LGRDGFVVSGLKLLFAPRDLGRDPVKRGAVHPIEFLACGPWRILHAPRVLEASRRS
jgi:hypothetical protein